MPKRQLLRSLGAIVLLVAFASAPPAAAQQTPAPGVGAWNPGPAASGDRNQLAGVVDSPSTGATVSGSTLRLSGWFVDLSAQGWAGADDVEIFNGTMETGKPLAHALFAQDRPDVANALKTPFWTQSGWSAIAPISGLPTGPLTLSVYVHTPGKGWWMRQVSVTVQPTGPSAQPAASVFGSDIASPQCPTNAEPPAPAFAIVGLTGGRPFTPNPCLPREFAWALSATSTTQPHVGFYMNTANPGPGASPHWPAPGITTPRTCDGSWSVDCAFDYGWLSAQDAFGRASGVAGGGAAQDPWWVDVEAVNSWSPDPNLNVADLQGVLAFLQARNIASIGIYSTSTDWEALIGPAAADGPFGGLPNWRPGPSDPNDAQSWCSRTVTGGRVKYVQFPSGGFDTDLACY